MVWPPLYHKKRNLSRERPPVMQDAAYNEPQPNNRQPRENKNDRYVFQPTEECFHVCSLKIGNAENAKTHDDTSGQTNTSHSAIKVHFGFGSVQAHLE